MTTATTNFVPCNSDTLIKQIGMMNIFAISGGRATIRETGISLPVTSGYVVEIDLAANDTYTVQRVRFAKGKRWEKGTVENVYCDEVSEVAYKASCFRNVEFGEVQNG